jgi:NAD(P)-dependent dehydrogenase (short-subunit alcohol dehydrogenase family)
MGTLKQLFDLSGKTALITGGSRGLGLQLAESLGELGARIVLSARKTGELQEAQAHLASLGIEADFIAADGSIEADIHRLADEALARLGRIDILVNNAGAVWSAPAEDHPIDAWDKVMDLNIRGLFLLTQQIGKRSMIPRGYGRIVNMASIGGLRGARREEHDCLQREQGGRREFHSGAGGRVGTARDYRQCDSPGLFPFEHDARVAQQVRRR